jgi:hypothetical protein
VVSYPTEAVWQEIAYLAYRLHWSLDDLLDLEHLDRVRLVRAVRNFDDHARREAHDGDD